MISLLNKYKNPILIMTVLMFLGSLGFVGAGVFIEEYGPNAAVATVNGQKIKYKDFNMAVNLLEREARNSEDFTEETAKKIRQEVLQSMINEASLSQMAKVYGLGTSDLEVGYTIQSAPIFNNGGAFNKKAYVWTVRNNFGMNPSEYEAIVKNQKAAAKLQNLLIFASKITPQEMEVLGTSTDKAVKKNQEQNPQAFEVAAIQLKAQALAGSFSDYINATQKIEVSKRDL